MDQETKDAILGIDGSLSTIAESLETIAAILESIVGETDTGRSFVRNIDMGRE
jgi:hypothetical protein